MAKLPFSTDVSKVDPNMPMRLDVAAKLAFPDGSIMASALRTEAKKGRLEILRIANKDMVTLAEIDAMKERCRVMPALPASGSSPPTLRRPPSTSPKTDRLALARAAALERARKPRST